MTDAFLQSLSPQQKEAVLHTQGPAMIIAGAGSGKTRVITYRIAHLLETGIEPHRILCLTFTNKAAREMRDRIDALVGAEARSVWMGTFHSVFARLLRSEADRIGYPSNFTIYDTEDSKNLIKNILKELNLSKDTYHPGYVFGRISNSKNNLIHWKQYAEDSDIQADDRASGRPHLAQIFEHYSKRCYKAGAMDFDDLLLNTWLLLDQFPEALYRFQQQFRYIMVDEFQDTNRCQYLILRRLAAEHRNLCVVGDDAQSIYAFRGANIKNILKFSQDFEGLRTYKLEQNYRSTQNLVEAANSLIAHNKERLPKNVYSTRDAGEKIKVLEAMSDVEEARLVCESMTEQRMQQGLEWNHFAVLYRTNAQSRSFEEALRRLNIPYRIYGGISFYQRREIKDLLAYFRLSLNPNDEEAFRRVINHPKRGVGDTSMDRLTVFAHEQGFSLWQAAERVRECLSGSALQNVDSFVQLIRSFQAIIAQKDAFEAAEYIAAHSGLLNLLRSDKSIEGMARLENVQELLNGIQEFSVRDDIEDHGLGVFLQEVALLTGEEEAVNQPHVSLMTAHASKGLEFKTVHVVGMEDGLFPSQMSMNTRSELEEERRLFYVSITRAKENLVLSYARSRFKYGSLNPAEPSRFLNELDARYLDFARRKRSVFEDLYGGASEAASTRNFRPPNGNGRREAPRQGNRNSATGTNKSPDPASLEKARTALNASKAYIHKPSADFVAQKMPELQEGMEVEHERFGFGRVVKTEGKFPDAKATIEFKELGAKQILLKFARLRIISQP